MHRVRGLLCELAAGIAIAGAFSLTGCSTSTGIADARTFAPGRMEVRSVSRSVQLAVAEKAAAEHEGDFVMAGAGNSMTPLFRSGTVVVVHPTSYFMLRSGMPVVYSNCRGVRVAHVLLEKSSRGWLVGGLNNAEPDDDLVTPENLIGVVRCAFASDDDKDASQTGGSFTVAAQGGGIRRIALLH